MCAFFRNGTQITMFQPFLSFSLAPARLRRAHHAPCLFLPRVSHARAPAVSKTRTQFVPFPGLARPRLVPGARPRTASVGRGPQKAFLHRSYDTAAVPGKSRGCAGHITHPVCAFSQPRTHAAFFECAPAVSKTRTRRPGAGPFFQTGASPALQLVMQRPPAKRFAQFMPAPAVSKSRACGEQVAHRVCAFSQPRTHARLRRASRAPCLCLCPASHARGYFRVRALARFLLAGARGCSGQIARASVYLRLLYQKGRVKSKRMDEFFRTFIRFYCGFGAAGGSENPRHARNGAKKEECAMCETAARRE